MGYPPTEMRPRAIAAARKALEIDEGLAEAHAALANILHYNWDWLAAEKEFKRALQLNPNDAQTHRWYCQYLASRGRMQAALAEVERALELDPLSTSTGYLKGFILMLARQYDEAIRQFQSVLEMEPNFLFATWHLGWTYVHHSMPGKGLEMLERATSLSGRSPGILGSLGAAYAMSGRRAEAEKLLSELVGLSKQRYVTPVAMAHISIALGDRDQAFYWLEKACQERSNLLAYTKVTDVLDPLRSDPRFEDLVRRVGLAHEP